MLPPTVLGIGFIYARFTTNGVRPDCANNVRVVAYWNTLLEEVFNATLMEVSKAGLDARWKIPYPEFSLTPFVPLLQNKLVPPYPAMHICHPMGRL